MKLPTREELQVISQRLERIDVQVGQTLAQIKDLQRWTYESLLSRFHGIKIDILKEYFRSRYEGVRPIHFVAAFSWMTMVPMTVFLKGLKVLEVERGMDVDTLEATLRCSNLSKKHFRLALDFIYTYLDADGRKHYDCYAEKIRKEFGSLDDFDDEQFLPPSHINLIDFGHDYYRSIGLALKDFRINNNLDEKIIATALGLSSARYKFLEDPDRSKTNAPFSLGIGIRVRLAFHHYSHFEFTQYMETYPQLHTLRIVQHIREEKIAVALRHVPAQNKAKIFELLDVLACN